MKFSNDTWALWTQRFPGADRAKAEAEMTADQADFLRKAGGNTEKAMGLLVLNTAKEMAEAFNLTEHFMLKQLIDRARNGKARKRLKAAVRLARGGH